MKLFCLPIQPLVIKLADLVSNHAEKTTATKAMAFINT